MFVPPPRPPMPPMPPVPPVPPMPPVPPVPPPMPPMPPVPPPPPFRLGRRCRRSESLQFSADICRKHISVEGNHDQNCH